MVTVCNVSPLTDDVNPTLSWKEYLDNLVVENDVGKLLPISMLNSLYKVTMIDEVTTMFI